MPGPHDFFGNEAELFGLQGKGAPGGLNLSESGRKKRILVYFVGGVTFGEIAAVRFLNSIFKDKKLIIATTQIINGDTCIEMFRGNIQNRLSLTSILQK